MSVSPASANVTIGTRKRTFELTRVPDCITDWCEG